MTKARPTRFGPRARFAVMVPLGLVSAACTLELCTASGGPVTGTLLSPSSVAQPATGAAPAAPATPSTEVPPGDQPVQTNPLVATPLTGTTTTGISLTDASANIPPAALAAYQRSATVVNAADASCHLPWQLVAAIGRVESDNGQAQGNTLSVTGVDSPGIFGPVLNGKHGTARVADTDGGALDGDKKYDRAVGPMQFIPSTWATVAVDADGDGKRDPQDINDAALATAVFLCADDANLSTAAGQRQAVYRYNHNWSYVRTVLSIAADYKANAVVPLDLGPESVTTVPAVYTVPNAPAHGHRGHSGQPAHDRGADAGHHSAGSAGTRPAHTLSAPDGSTDSTDSAGGSPTGTASSPSTSSTPSAPATPSAPSTPSAPAGQDSGSGDPTPATTDQLTDLCTNGTDTIDGILATYPDASADTLQDAEAYCVEQLNGQTLADAQTALADLIAGLTTQYPDLVPTPSDPPSSDPTPSTDAPSTDDGGEPGDDPSAPTDDPATTDGAA